MAKHAKKRKPQHRSPIKAQQAEQQKQQTPERPSMNAFGILALVLMIGGVFIASMANKTLGCLISLIGASLNLVNSSLRKMQTKFTIALYIIYIVLVVLYWFGS